MMPRIDSDSNWRGSICLGTLVPPLFTRELEKVYYDVKMSGGYFAQSKSTENAFFWTRQQLPDFLAVYGNMSTKYLAVPVAIFEYPENRAMKFLLKKHQILKPNFWRFGSGLGSRLQAFQVSGFFLHSDLQIRNKKIENLPKKFGSLVRVRLYTLYPYPNPLENRLISVYFAQVAFDWWIQV